MSVLAVLLSAWGLLVVFCFVQAEKDWREVDLLRLKWDRQFSSWNGVLYIPAGLNASISITTNLLSGYRSLHNGMPHFESGIFFNLSWSERLHCHVGPAHDFHLDFRLNGNSVMSNVPVSTESLTPRWFMLRMNSDPEKNIFYSLAFAATTSAPLVHEYCAVELHNPTLTYTPEPKYVPASTNLLAQLNYASGKMEKRVRSGKAIIHRRAIHATSYIHNSTGKVVTISPECDLLGSSHAVLLNQLNIPVVLGNSSSHYTADSSRNGEGSSNENVRLFCGIYTTSDHHKSHISVIRDTWGHRCTGFMALSTETDNSVPSISIPHMGEEAYNNMWQKVRSIWKYVYMYYEQEYDFFLLGGDDLYIVIESLFAFLNSSQIREEVRTGKGLYLGRKFRGSRYHKHALFNSGGAGYILDRVALQILVHNLDRAHCNPHNVGQSYEDVNVATCLAGAYREVHVTRNEASVDERVNEVLEVTKSGEIVNKNDEKENLILRIPTPVLPIDSNDEQGRARFHPFPPGAHWLYNPKTPNGTMQNDWFNQYDPTMKFGLDCCSSESVSFHYIGPELMWQLHDYIYHCSATEKEMYFDSFGRLHYDTYVELRLQLIEK